MSDHTDGHWEAGYTLHTQATRRWTAEKRAENDAIEEVNVFSHFTPQDEGRSRVRICEMNRGLPNWKANQKLILAAPDLYESLGKALRMLTRLVNLNTSLKGRQLLKELDRTLEKANDNRSETHAS